MRFCFRLGWLLGASVAALQAGGPAGAPERVVTVVRADPHTGKLVRAMVVQHAAAAESRRPAAAIAAAVDRIAAEHVLPPELIHSVIRVESNYDPAAVSPKGARGLMQLIPSTARRFGVENAFDPVENIQGGARYLKYLLDLYHGSYPLALAAYNAGEQAVARYGGVPPFAETRNYVAQVEKHLAETGKPAAGEPDIKENNPAAMEPAGPPHVQEVVEADGTVRYVSR